MRASNHGFPLFSLLFFSVFLALQVSNGALIKNFYWRSCPQAEPIIKDVTFRLARSNPALGAQLLRLQFHDCFVRGCDGSILLNTVGGNQSEKEARPNQSLFGFEAIDEIKSEVEKACPGVVSCADILTLAARDAVSFPFKNQPRWPVLTGRRDGRISQSSEVAGNIPSPFSDFATLKQIFEKKGLTANDLVILSGGHTIGVAHCGTFSRRLYNFTGKGDADPLLDPKYADMLRRQCPNPANTSITVEMDPRSSHSFDSKYFKILTQKKGLFQSDAALLTDVVSSRLVGQLRNPLVFSFRFADSMLKMSAIEVLTGTNGEIRKHCRFVN
ncbi:LOW QUALITY PROTEIN: peroxidase 24-like [Momordica charantia]|uniref:Peroxidase n=1 Tax=Momordica charantia TaxID=3673 RepID=A0A6J1CB06_MOMCH|nr:LOW QUALITY PROTEIN: peroxidase 24-like [Momordica charantia]